MARPLSTSGSYRGGTNGNQQVRIRIDEQSPADTESAQEMEHLRAENTQLRSLCAELEQALQEATQHQPDQGAIEERIREYEALVEEKTDAIRTLHEQLQEARLALEESQSAAGRIQGPVPREDDLLQLSEELERERRQLREDEQTVMEQMRQMELTMARERADMARQRNELQRLYGEIRHELERLERSGALQTKMDELKAKLQDVQNRRGAAPGAANRSSSGSTPDASASPAPTPPKGSFIGRLFGNK
jgi:chromosome segregation ATPase